VEVLYKRGRGELHLCQELTVLAQHLALRRSLLLLQAAAQLALALSKNLLPGKPAPHLYQLLIAYLGALPDAVDFSAVVSSFRLKLLLHEGLLALPVAAPFTDEESMVVGEMAATRSLARVRSLEASAQLHQKIESFFINVIDYK